MFLSEKQEILQNVPERNFWFHCSKQRNQLNISIFNSYMHTTYLQKQRWKSAAWQSVLREEVCVGLNCKAFIK